MAPGVLALRRLRGRGELLVLMKNYVSTDFQIERGMKIAQLILERISFDAEVVEVAELPWSTRHSGGFGSTSYRNFLTMDPTNIYNPTEMARLDAYFEHQRRGDPDRARTRVVETAESNVPASSNAAGGMEGASGGNASGASSSSSVNSETNEHIQ